MIRRKQLEAEAEERRFMLLAEQDPFNPEVGAPRRAGGFNSR